MIDAITETDMSGIFESVIEISSANAYKIRVDFDYRFRIWKNEILPDRLLSIKMEHSVEFVHRMMDLLIDDADRLTNRAIREFEHEPTLVNTIEEIDVVMKEAISDYISEIDIIKLSICKRS